jgi:hypothetical protein
MAEEVVQEIVEDITEEPEAQKELKRLLVMVQQDRKIQKLLRLLEENSERRRAMLLSWVDELERINGYGEPGNQPRTAQIRQFWRDSGEPDIS